MGKLSVIGMLSGCWLWGRGRRWVGSDQGRNSRRVETHPFNNSEP